MTISEGKCADNRVPKTIFSKYRLLKRVVMNLCTWAVHLRPSVSLNFEAASERVFTLKFIIEITIQWDDYHA